MMLYSNPFLIEKGRSRQGPHPYLPGTEPKHPKLPYQHRLPWRPLQKHPQHECPAKVEIGLGGSVAAGTPLFAAQDPAVQLLEHSHLVGENRPEPGQNPLPRPPLLRQADFALRVHAMTHGALVLGG